MTQTDGGDEILSGQFPLGNSGGNERLRVPGADTEPRALWGTALISPGTHSLSRFTIITFVTRGTILTLKRRQKGIKEVFLGCEWS